MGGGGSRKKARSASLRRKKNITSRIYLKHHFVWSQNWTYAQRLFRFPFFCLFPPFDFISIIIIIIMIMNLLPSIFRFGRRFVWQRLAWVMSSPRYRVPTRTSTDSSRHLTTMTHTCDRQIIIGSFFSYHTESHSRF